MHQQLPFGDDFCHPLMGILKIVSYWGLLHENRYIIHGNRWA